MRKILWAGAAALALSAAPAMADTGVPSSYFEGGGCFNFIMNGVQYSLANVGIGEGQLVPRGGQATIDGWKALLREVPKGTVTFTRRDPINATICPLQGFDLVGVKSP